MAPVSHYRGPVTVPLRYGSPQARTVLVATILASGVGFLDGTLVTVALPRIGEDLGGGLATLQWVFDSYLLTLGALVLIGGALGDLLGRRRVFQWGIAAFAATSVLCGLAPNAPALIAARTLQGAAAALMVPASLAILSSVFAGADRGRAIGLWSGWSGVTTAIGPFVGGAMVDAAPWGWRAVFLINVPLCVVAFLLARRSVPDLPPGRTDAPLREQLDVLGGVLALVGLALVIGPLIEFARIGRAVAVAGVLAGVAVLVGFVLLERHRERTRQPPPMLPPSLFGIRTFAVANLQTFVVYGALGGTMFVLTLALQIGLGWSALAAGAAVVPITLILLLGSSRAGGLVTVVGARPLLTAGPLLMAVGAWLLSRLGPGAGYLTDVLPGVLAFAVGLVLVVAPITTTALGDIPQASAGVGSGVNNGVARIASLVAVAAIPLAAGLAGAQAESGDQIFPGAERALIATAALCVGGAAVAAFGYPADAGKVAGASGPEAAEASH
jgi:EmrB/QacA subfamily drug resistance transporter